MLRPALLALLMVSGPVAAAPKCERPYAGELRWSGIESFIAEQRIRDLDTLLACLPRSYRRHFTLVYESRSPEQTAVDFRFPRILFFGEDAKLIIAATGDPKRPFFDELQVLEFVEEEARFVIRRVVFGGDGPPAIEVNPPACLECHGRDPRPIWDTYDLWPGVYGSDGDVLKRGTSERRRFEQFKRSRGARYRALVFGKPSLWPYQGDEEPIDIETSPNHRMGKLLWRYNARRVLRQLAAAPRFEASRGWLASALLGCEPFPVPPQEQAAVTRHLSDELQSKLERMPRDGRSMLPVEPRFYARGAARVARLAQAAGADPSEWSMSLQRGSWDMHDGDAGLDDLLLAELLRGAAASQPELAKHLRIVDEGARIQARGIDPDGSIGGRYRYERWAPKFAALGGAVHVKKAREACALLLAGSTKPELEVAAATTGRGDGADSNPLEASCGECHDGYAAGGRALPFSEPERMRALLLAEPKLHKELLRRLSTRGPDRMPPQEKLAPEQLDAIRAWLEKLTLPGPAPETP